MRVRFLVTKRYPHPDGVKRYPGDEVEVTREIGDLWVERGIVEAVEDEADDFDLDLDDDLDSDEDEAEADTEQPEQPDPPLLPDETPKDDPAGQPEDAPTELATEPNSDLRTHTPDVAAPAFGEVVSNAEPQPVKKGRK